MAEKSARRLLPPKPFEPTFFDKRGGCELVQPFKPSTIMVVDFDWTYQCWLTGILSDAGFRVLPMRSVADADLMIRTSSPAVDLMIVDPRVAGVGEFVDAVRLRETGLKVIAAVEQGAAAHCGFADVVFEKPRDAAERDTLAGSWLAAIHIILRRDFRAGSR